MKKIFFSLMALAIAMTAFAYDQAVSGTDYYGSQCKAVGLADGTVAIVEYYIPDAYADKTDLVFPATIEIWENEAKTAEYEVSTIGGGWTMWVKLGDENKLNTITSITIPEGVKVIAQSTFYEATALATLNLPASLESIDGWAFGGCGALTRINCKAATAPTLGSDVFKYSDEEWDKILNQCFVYVPTEAAQATYNTAEWSYWQSFYTNGHVIVDTSTAIENTHAKTNATKIIRDGQVLILKNGKTFNALGVEVK